MLVCVCVCVCVCVQTVPYISPRWHSVDTLTPLVLILEHSNCEGRGQRVIPLVSIGPNISSELPFIREKLIPSYSGGGRHEDSAAEVNTFITAWPPLEEGISARWWGRVGCFLAGVWQQGVTRLCVCVCVCVCVCFTCFLYPCRHHPRATTWGHAKPRTHMVQNFGWRVLIRFRLFLTVSSVGLIFLRVTCYVRRILRLKSNLLTEKSNPFKCT